MRTFHFGRLTICYEKKLVNVQVFLDRSRSAIVPVQKFSMRISHSENYLSEVRFGLFTCVLSTAQESGQDTLFFDYAKIYYPPWVYFQIKRFIKQVKQDYLQESL